tara:strand:+ start:659 stop:1390 length:732 start_codon:yes stop_codon:yes gene_type:complete
MKPILITGASSGIGLKTLEKAISKSYFPIAAVREPDKLKNILESKKIDQSRYKILYCDMKSEESINSLIYNLRSQKIILEMAVLNAGFISTASSLMTTSENMNDHMLINYTNQVLLAQMIVKNFFLKGKKGSLVAISSSASIDANPGRLAYASSKSAFTTAMRVMSKELGRKNIRINIVAPGLTETKLMRESTESEEVDKFIKGLSIPRVGKPEEIANLILFLASYKSSYITGQVISCDGGIR